MTPGASDDAIPVAIPHPTTALSPHALRLAEGTVPVAIPRARLGLRGVIAAIVMLAVALAITWTLYQRAARREAAESAFPIVADGNDADAIDYALARWSPPRLLAAVGAFHAPALDTLAGAGACPFTAAGTSFRAGPELVDDVRTWLDDTLAAARRGRFSSTEARDDLVARLSGPVIIVADHVSYALDPSTGALVCAGTTTLRAVE